MPSDILTRLAQSQQMFQLRGFEAPVDNPARLILSQNPLRVYLAFYFTSPGSVSVGPQTETSQATPFIVTNGQKPVEFYIEKHKALLQAPWWGFSAVLSSIGILEVSYIG